MNSGSGYNNPLVADTYDFVVPYRKRNDVGFFVDLAKECGKQVLELGCGTGRILIPTAREKMQITGLDLSSEMLRVCRHSLDREPESVQNCVDLVQSDMRDFDLGKQFHLVTIPFRTFHHLLHVADQIKCLSSIRRHLYDGGRLTLDLFNPSLPYLYDKRFQKLVEEEPPFQLPDGRRMLRRCQLLARDLHQQILTLEFLYEWRDENGAVQQYSHQMILRYFFRYEIEHLLARTGFELECVYADYKKTPFGSQYPGELIVVARKAA
ncbi:MAG: class I SAM-dependent methyltransferase [Candidatus Omnitrophica bacterium]|nr:class I SAM-dependent methyltransferase [Candidatus Omnitrophota bacterium]